jgi:hypothetical protein
MANWCDHCELAQEGDTCNVCGADLAPEELGPIPWKWRFFLIATVIYVIWRIYQLISWLAH